MKRLKYQTRCMACGKVFPMNYEEYISCPCCKTSFKVYDIRKLHSWGSTTQQQNNDIAADNTIGCFLFSIIAIFIIIAIVSCN